MWPCQLLILCPPNSADLLLPESPVQRLRRRESPWRGAVRQLDATGGDSGAGGIRVPHDHDPPV